MEARELRIGNIIEHPTKGARGYTYVNHRTINYLASHPEPLAYKAIPLTEEWLIKFGALSKDGCVWIDFALHSDTPFVSYRSVEKCCYFHPNMEGKFEYKIQYVHQLQNLHFALTGKELQIK